MLCYLKEKINIYILLQNIDLNKLGNWASKLITTVDINKLAIRSHLKYRGV